MYLTVILQARNAVYRLVVIAGGVKLLVDGNVLAFLSIWREKG